MRVDLTLATDCWHILEITTVAHAVIVMMFADSNQVGFFNAQFPIFTWGNQVVNYFRKAVALCAVFDCLADDVMLANCCGQVFPQRRIVKLTFLRRSIS